MEKLLTIDELAGITRKSTAQIYNMISQGREGEDLPRSIKMGRSRRWPESEVYDWIKRQLEASRESNKCAVANVATKTINRI